MLGGMSAPGHLIKLGAPQNAKNGRDVRAGFVAAKIRALQEIRLRSEDPSRYSHSPRPHDQLAPATAAFLRRRNSFSPSRSPPPGSLMVADYVSNNNETGSQGANNSPGVRKMQSRNEPSMAKVSQKLSPRRSLHSFGDPRRRSLSASEAQIPMIPPVKSCWQHHLPSTQMGGDEPVRTSFYTSLNPTTRNSISDGRIGIDTRYVDRQVEHEQLESGGRPSSQRHGPADVEIVEPVPQRSPTKDLGDTIASVMERALYEYQRGEKNSLESPHNISTPRYRFKPLESPDEKPLPASQTRHREEAKLPLVLDHDGLSPKLDSPLSGTFPSETITVKELRLQQTTPKRVPTPFSFVYGISDNGYEDMTASDRKVQRPSFVSRVRRRFSGGVSYSIVDSTSNVILHPIHDHYGKRLLAADTMMTGGKHRAGTKMQEIKDKIAPPGSRRRASLRIFSDSNDVKSLSTGDASSTLTAMRPKSAMTPVAPRQEAGRPMSSTRRHHSNASLLSSDIATPSSPTRIPRPSGQAPSDTSTATIYRNSRFAVRRKARIDPSFEVVDERDDVLVLVSVGEEPESALRLEISPKKGRAGRCEACHRRT